MNWDTPTRTPLGLLTLLNLRGIGRQTTTKLAGRFAALREVVDCVDSEIDRLVPRIARGSFRNRQLWATAHEVGHAILDRANQENIKVLSFFDEAYPVLLRRIPDPPPLLFVKGALPNSIRNVACVGTRDATFFGVEVTRRMVRMLSEHGFGIISGLAIGIDSESHRQAVENGGYTVAILANGLDSIYPRENRKLAETILERGGALISEQPFGTRAVAQNLVDRDRLQSGMSLATFVFQTDVVGGTMHTVRFTLTQERLLFAPVPPSKYAFEERCRGIRAIVEKTGRELADILKPSGPYRELLTTRFANHPPAIGVKGVTDYPAVIEQLERIAKHAESNSFRP
jgi:DNA processing protein